MRARLALVSSAQPVILREVVLRDKPAAFLEVSSSGTVPCLVSQDGVIDESLDIMIWALSRHDPDGWLESAEAGMEWIARCDGPFKDALDRTKYAIRYPDTDPVEERAKASAFLYDLDAQIDDWIFARPGLVDFALLPFVRQFAFIDKPWFDAQDWPRVRNWLERFLASPLFAAIMGKYPQWQPGAPKIVFPAAPEQH
jgi:glutathione S-transferase